MNESELSELQAKAYALEQNIQRVIVGQRRVIREMLIPLFCNSHALLEGVPGLAKTLLVRTIAQSVELTFRRVQFTPDLMPSDITGSEVFLPDQGTFHLRKGPIFAHILLADEINRAPPKTQSALLEAMQERQVTIGEATHRLPDPFFVLATQNPIEQEGTYPLPEAQLDRFMFYIQIGYLEESEEVEMVRRTTGEGLPEVSPVLTREDILAIQRLVRALPISDFLLRQIVRFVQCTRPGFELSPSFIREYVQWGAGPRASQFLALGARAHAFLEGKAAPDWSDVQPLLAPVLRHRVILNYKAHAEGVTVESLLRRLEEHLLDADKMFRS